MEKNKTGKYLKYAIGEILLVVIGILIALQINNWNEFKLTEDEELRYLQRLKIDLIQDTLYYNQRIVKSRKSIENNSEAMKIAYESQRNLKDFQDLLILYDFDSEYLTIQDDTYREMTNAGKLNIIKNEKLKIAIIKIYRFSGVSDKHIKEFNQFSVALLTDLNTSTPFFKYYPYSEIREIFNDGKMFNDSDWEFINDPTSYKFRLLENCMLTYVSKHTKFLSYFFDLKSESKLIIEIIDDELKSRH